MGDAAILVRELDVEFLTPRGPVRAIDGADLDLTAGEILGIVGESGSGKSTLASVLGGLLPSNARISANRIEVLGRNIVKRDPTGMREFRRHSLAYVFQDPIGTLDPTAKISRQLRALIRLKDPQVDPAALLARVGVPEVDRVINSYPHELSGGLAQRVSIAMAIIGRPKLLIADEPTAALDASIRAQILELLVSLVSENAASMLLLSHDLRAVAKHCTAVSVMYAGRVVESGSTAVVFARPLHPYTIGLLAAEPSFAGEGDRIEAITGTPPILTGRSLKCAFVPRCSRALPSCEAMRPLRDPKSSSMLSATSIEVTRSKRSASAKLSRPVPAPQSRACSY